MAKAEQTSMLIVISMNKNTCEMPEKSKTTYIPDDSEHDEPKDNKVVKKEADKRYRKTVPEMGSPAKKRKYSEQPPTKHNTHN